MTKQRNYYAIIPADVRYDTRLNSSEKLLYGEITCLANETGVCWAQNSYFADLYNVSTRTVKRWLQNLVDKGYIITDLHKSESNEILNRYISINTQIGVTKMSLPSGQKCPYPRDKNVPHNNTSLIINNNIKKNKQKESEKAYKDEFESVWAEYPKKVGKDKAKQSYVKARFEGVKKETILKAIADYCKQINIQKTERRFIKDGSTWFNNRCWQDEYITESDKPKQENYAGYDLQKYKEIFGLE